MSDPVKQLENMLRDNHFQLVRQTHHKVYRNPDGKVFVTSLTPSDYRWAQNALTTLRRTIVSPPVPEVIAISEFERQQAASIIQPQSKEPGPGHTKQKSSRGTGFVYIDKKIQEVVSTVPPEQKLAEKAQHQWESAVRRARQDFVDLIAAKAKPLIFKSNQDYERRRQEEAARYVSYADTKLKRDVEIWCSETCDCFCESWVSMHKVSDLFYDILEISDPPSAEYQDDELWEQALACSKCIKTRTEEDTQVRFCAEHQYQDLRKIALNMDRFLPREMRITRDDIVKDAKIMFRRALSDEDFWQTWDRAASINVRKSEDILWRYALKKLRPIVEELLRSRCGSPTSRTPV